MLIVRMIAEAVKHEASKFDPLGNKYSSSVFAITLCTFSNSSTKVQSIKIAAALAALVNYLTVAKEPLSERDLDIDKENRIHSVAINVVFAVLLSMIPSRKQLMKK